MPTGQTILILALAAGVVYGGIKAAHGVKFLAVHTARVVTHPFRHPKKDAKAVGHALTHPAILKQ
jgi:hypothetical protein